jgi:glycosyltransferase involved in cell wall biosynthesis
MRIAQLTFSYLPVTGGADAYLAELTRVLEKAGHTVTVYQRDAGVGGPEVRLLPTPRGLSPGRQFWLLPLFLLRHFRALARQDVIIAHYPNYALPVLWHPRVIGLSHGVTWDDAPGSWAARLKRALARAAFRGCAAFVANDTFFLREMGLPIAPQENPFTEVRPGRWFIPNGVDLAHFHRQEGDADLQKLKPILVPRNLYRNRGIHLAIQAFAEFRREQPDTHLVIVGGAGQPDYVAELHRLMDDLQLRDRVRFWGSVAWREMPTVYSSAELTLIPSTCGEGTSLSALESMACGTATIATTAGGLPDLPTVHCAPTAADLLRTLRETYPARERIAAAQQQTVQRTFSLDRWAAAWRQVVEAVVIRET